MLSAWRFARTRLPARAVHRIGRLRPKCNFSATLIFVLLASAAIADGAQGMPKREQLMEWARSSEPADHRRLRDALADRATLQALDRNFAPVARRGAPPQPTPYDEILTALALNAAPEAREAFSALAADSKFAKAAADSPLDPLSAWVRASASLPQPDRRVVDLWRRLSAPSRGDAPLVVDTLISNGSPQAIDVLVALAASKEYSSADKVSWLRDSLSPRRTAEPALAAAERLLQSQSVTKPVKTAVVEALFTRDTSKWFTPGTWPGPPPDAAAATAAARQARQRIARNVLAGGLALPRALRPDVEAAVDRP